MKYRKKPSAVEAISFDDFVEYGKTHATNIVNGMPWSFTFEGVPVSHENDSLYILTTETAVIKFRKDHMLLFGGGGFYPMSLEDFNKAYEPDEARENGDLEIALKDHSFESVNEFVHSPIVEFEQLQSLCLSLAVKLESKK